MPLRSILMRIVNAGLILASFTHCFTAHVECGFIVTNACDSPTELSLSSISPNEGSTRGGTALTLTGTGFQDEMSVSVGDVACSSVSIVSSTQAVCTTPAGSEGTVSVSISRGDATASLKNAFTFVAGNVWKSMAANHNITSGHSATWMSASMLVLWGSSADDYVAASDKWESRSTTGMPSNLSKHTAVWTGSKLIVFGGGAGGASGAGAMYNPETDTWESITSSNARHSHVGVWTGESMLVWGGRTAVSYLRHISNDVP